jgi:hypothetical protein
LLQRAPLYVGRLLVQQKEQQDLVVACVRQSKLGEFIRNRRTGDPSGNFARRLEPHRKHVNDVEHASFGNAFVEIDAEIAVSAGDLQSRTRQCFSELLQNRITQPIHNTQQEGFTSDWRSKK